MTDPRADLLRARELLVSMNRLPVCVVRRGFIPVQSDACVGEAFGQRRPHPGAFFCFHFTPAKTVFPKAYQRVKGVRP